MRANREQVKRDRKEEEKVGRGLEKSGGDLRISIDMIKASNRRK